MRHYLRRQMPHLLHSPASFKRFCYFVSELGVLVEGAGELLESDDEVVAFDSLFDEASVLLEPPLPPDFEPFA